MSIRTLIADDQQLVRTGFSLILKPYPDIEVVGEAADGHQATALAHDLVPDVILMDIGMPRMNGYEAATTIRGKPWGKEIVLVALTGWGQDEDRQRSSDAAARPTSSRETSPTSTPSTRSARR